MVILSIITAHLSVLKMKGVLVISSSNVQTALQKISKTSIPLVLLFLIFAVVLSDSSLSVDAAQTESGNTPDSGTISDTFMYDNKVVKGGRDVSFYGGSVIYPVMPNTEYFVRILSQSRTGSPLVMDTTMYFFNGYPSAGVVPNSSTDSFVLSGSVITYHFTTNSSTYFAMLPLWSDEYGYTYADIRSLIESASIGDTLGLYSPLSNNSAAELSFGFTNPRELKLFLSGSGGVGDYRFTVDVHYTGNNSENLLSRVLAGNYTRIVPALDNGDYLTITISDRLTSISTKIVPYIPDVNINTLSSPEVDISEIPDASISVDNNVASIIVNAFDAFPTEITALLVPVVLFCLVGWWVHK